MGSFNVSCGISKLHINEGDRAGIILLHRHITDLDIKYARGIYTPGTLYSIEKTFLPFCPAIYGTYDDYGRLTDIEESNTTKYLETVLRRPFEEVMKAVGVDRGVYDPKDYGGIAAVYAPEDMTEFGYDDKDNQDFLLNYGFTKEEGTSQYVYAGATLDFDENKIITKRGNTLDLSRFSFSFSVPDKLQVFGDYTGMWPGYEKEDWAAITLANQLAGMYFLPEMATAVEASLTDDFFYKSKNNRITEAWEKSFQKLEEDPEMIWVMNLPLYEALRNSAIIPIEYFKTYLDTVTLKDTLDMLTLEMVCNAVASPLQPSYCGTQFEELKSEMALAEAVNKLLAARFAEYGE